MSIQDESEILDDNFLEVNTEELDKEFIGHLSDMNA
jgi:hypothetical protein